MEKFIMNLMMAAGG